MKPRLPKDVEKTLPPHVLHLIYSFVPPIPSPKWPNGTYEHVKKLQNSPKTKRTCMDLKGMEDFVLK